MYRLDVQVSNLQHKLKLKISAWLLLHVVLYLKDTNLLNDTKGNGDKASYLTSTDFSSMWDY